MSDPRAQLQRLRALIESAPALPERGDWLALIDAAMPAAAASGAGPEIRTSQTPSAPATPPTCSA